MRDHGDRGNRIIGGMLLHARQDAGESVLADLNTLVAEHVNLAYHGLRSQQPAVHVALETRLDTALGMVPMVPQELGRLVLNLAQNACYAAAVPFYRNDLVSTGLVAGVLFGLPVLVARMADAGHRGQRGHNQAA